jgi:L-ornithine N5-oxygenase
VETYDLIGVGFGPSNLSVAVAAHESDHGLRLAFVDRRPEFAWHPGLMFESAEMQVAFTKDLITMRNPCSRFSFLNYLKARGRLATFINLRSFYPTRTEFNDYYGWVAEQFDESVSWGTEIVGVEVDHDSDGAVDALLVQLRDVATGACRVLRTHSLVLAPGGTPAVPPAVELGSRVIHASEALPRLTETFTDPVAPYHFNIVGAGQTAADVFVHLRRTYPNARITTNIRGFAIRAEDDTHFVNELFMPEMPDWFYESEPAFRQAVLDKYGLAAHTGVSYDLIPALYREYYEDSVTGRNALQLHRFTELTSASGNESAATAHYRHLDTGAALTVESDAVILATGYRYPMPIELLAGVHQFLLMATEDRYAIGRDYDIQTPDGFRPRIFLQGYAEATHGFSEVLLSLMPFRAAEIVDAVAAARPVAAAN